MNLHSIIIALAISAVIISTSMLTSMDSTEPLNNMHNLNTFSQITTKAEILTKISGKNHVVLFNNNQIILAKIISYDSPGFIDKIEEISRTPMTLKRYMELGFEPDPIDPKKKTTDGIQILVEYKYIE